MISSKKRSAESDSDGQVKKPKFEKKSGQKGKPDFKVGPKGKNPFKKPGNFKNGAGGKGGNFKAKFQKPANGKGASADGKEAPANAAPTEKKDWNKYKQERKELKKTRKATKSNFDKIHEAKQIYEKLKCKSTPNKEELCAELHKMFRCGDAYQKLVMAHDTARIIQCLLKHSPQNICQEISESLLPVIGKLAVCEYAHFCVPRLLKYGPAEIKKKVIDALFGNILLTLSRPKSNSIIDTIYVSYANSQQKAFMRQELYGDLYKASKEKGVKCRNDTYKDAPHMKLAVLNSVKSNLEHFANKGVVDNGLIHAVMHDYLNECNEQDRAEIVALYLPHLAALVTTKDGVRSAMLLFYHSIVKDRRAILKTVREHLIKICTNEIEKIVGDEWGRKVVEWFVAPADTTYFHPQTIALLEEGLKFSKKDKDVRRAELLEAVDDSLCQAISENPYFWLRGGHIAQVTVTIAKNCKGNNLKNALSALADVVCNVDWMVSPNEPTELENKEAEKNKIKKLLEPKENEAEQKEVKPELIAGVEHAGLHIALKKLLKSTQFPTHLAEKLTDEVVKNWLPLNRASFLLLNTFENGDNGAQEQVKKIVKNQVKLLKQQSHAASKLLITKLGL